MRVFPIAVLVSVCAIGSVQASETSGDSQPPTQASPGNAVQSDAQKVPAKDRAKDQVICKSVEETGSHFRKRVCMTAADWDKLAMNSQRRANNLGRIEQGSSGK